MRSERDVQRAKLYRAENEVRLAIGDKAMKDRIAVWAFVEKIERDHWFRRTFGPRKFDVRDGRGRTSAGAWGRQTITLPRWSRTPLIILHEIAHCCAPAEVHHGWRYAAIYLKLVRHFLGTEVHDKLRASFRAHHVRYKKPRASVPLTEEQRAVLRARLAAIRPHRAAAKMDG